MELPGVYCLPPPMPHYVLTGYHSPDSEAQFLRYRHLGDALVFIPIQFGGILLGFEAYVNFVTQC